MSAVPIQFVQDDDREILVKDGWPQWALIAHDLCNRPVALFQSGSADYLLTSDGEFISIAVKNGKAKYKINFFASDGTYHCDLVQGQVNDA